MDHLFFFFQINFLKKKKFVYDGSKRIPAYGKRFNMYGNGVIYQIQSIGIFTNGREMALKFIK